MAFEKVKADVRNAVEDFDHNYVRVHRSIWKEEEDVIVAVVDVKKEAVDHIFDHPSNDPHDCYNHRPDLYLNRMNNVIEDEKADNLLLAFLNLLKDCQNCLYANFLHDVNDYSFRRANVERIGR